MEYERHKFPPIIGPEEKPIGSFARAEEFGHELNHTLELAAEVMGQVADVVKRILAEQEQVLTGFKAQSLNEFFFRCTGFGEDDLMQCLHDFGHHDLCG